MIYLDTSVALAQLLAEDHYPPEDLWAETLVSSRLLEYELWNRINARGLAESHDESLRTLLGRMAFLELSPTVLARALQPFPVPVRTLDALHLASATFLLERSQEVLLASYDRRMLETARGLGVPVYDL